MNLFQNSTRKNIAAGGAPDAFKAAMMVESEEQARTCSPFSMTTMATKRRNNGAAHCSVLRRMRRIGGPLHRRNKWVLALEDDDGRALNNKK